MAKTREKILRAARLLFNTHGVAKVSQRAISDHIAISPGNLTYHFKKRDDIILALYFELVEVMNECFEEVTTLKPSLEVLLNFTKKMNKELFEYRFFMIDFIQILRSNKKIKKHYVKLSSLRQKQIQDTIEALINQGLIREEELPNEYKFLYKRFQLFGDFWIASIGTTKEDVMLKHTRSYTEIFMQSIYPYLTEKGKIAFRKVMGYSA